MRPKHSFTINKVSKISMTRKSRIFFFFLNDSHTKRMSKMYTEVDRVHLFEIYSNKSLVYSRARLAKTNKHLTSKALIRIRPIPETCSIMKLIILFLF
ncbi:hypothetical protein BpHYR1_049161 [Brachionus plicatilis]|uniref:Uncharacterized protein n=1 Tax=Brachionus plicatilis TaxID=10195 RepID=A0A3M7QVP2_BRAPC|nr:hypothetical protein BpHYR1_049161 [Brachionus plicatilis]